MAKFIAVGDSASSWHSSFITKNLLLVFLILLALVLAPLSHQRILEFPSMVHWDTILALAGLLLVTTGIGESGFFDLIAYRVSHQIADVRVLGLTLVSLAAALSTFLTNDITLFIMVPLTLGLEKALGQGVMKIIFLETIAVNVGSSLTPIGNPQNIFLWHKWGISFPVFVQQMAPVFFIMVAVLLMATLACVHSKKLPAIDYIPLRVDRVLLALSVTMLVAFTVSIELRYARYFLWVVFACFLAIRRKVVLKSDWGLIFLFIAIFIDVHLIAQLKVVRTLIGAIDFTSPPALFLAGALSSQVISNVPAAVLLAKYATNYKIIAYGVSIGGNGLAIGSFANLITLRLLKKKSAILRFHAYSLPYFVATLLLTYYFLIHF